MYGIEERPNELPQKYPTQLHEPEFWEWLGRAVATFGFLELTLGRAIFALTATRIYENEEELRKANEKWLPILEKALTDELGGLIRKFDESVRAHSTPCKVDFYGKLIEDLDRAKEIRNILCHASWQSPDSKGKSLPFFVRRDRQIVETKMDVAYLQQVQQGTANLSGYIVNVVLSMGLQFPGSKGPGNSFG
jgi:hypothetical protein